MIVLTLNIIAPAMIKITFLYLCLPAMQIKQTLAKCHLSKRTGGKKRHLLHLSQCRSLIEFKLRSLL